MHRIRAAFLRGVKKPLGIERLECGCVVLAINGLLVGAYLRANVPGLQHTDPVLFPKIVETALILVLMRLDYVGVRTGGKVRYVIGFFTLGPILIVMFGAHLGGHFDPFHVTPLGIPAQTSILGVVTLFMYWQYRHEPPRDPGGS